MRMQKFICAPSGNSQIAPALETHRTCGQRVVGEGLVRDIWDPHTRVLRACQRVQ